MADVLHDVRAIVRAERMTAPSSARSAAHLLVIIAMTVGAGAAGAWLDTWWAWAVAWLVIAWFFLSGSVIVHETSHGHLFTSRRANRVVGHTIGALCAIPFGTYRAFHLEHHRTTAGPGDPEGGPYTFPTRLLYLGLLPFGGPAFIVEMVAFTVGGAIGWGPRWLRTPAQRREVAVSAVLQVLMVMGVAGAWSVHAELVVKLWLVPYVLALTVLFPFFLYPEHAGGGPSENPLLNSRTITSNAWVRYWGWNGCFHAEHHAVPAVTYRNLPRLHDLVDPLRPPAWKNRSYTEFHVQRLRDLPTLRRRPTSDAGSGRAAHRAMRARPRNELAGARVSRRRSR